MTVKQMPIPSVNDEMRDIISEKVETLLKLNLEKQELNKQALEVLRAEYKLFKVTKKIENFLLLGWNEFIEELEKQKVRISMTRKDELNSWFRSKQDAAKNLRELTERLGKEIDITVYGLYNLTEDEIKLMERENNHGTN